MKLKTAIVSFVLLGLLGQSESWAQVQFASPGPNYPTPAQAYAPYPMEGYYPQNAGYPQNAAYPQNAVMPAACNACGGAAGVCGCNDGSGGGGLHSLFSSGKCCNGIWGDVEYLLWWGKERYVPVLVTTSPANTPQAAAGRLGLPTTSVLYGDERIGDDPRSGFRISLGAWLDQRQTVGVGARYFTVGGNDDDTFSATSNNGNGNPILAHPFFNTQLNGQDALLVAFPGISNNGSISVVSTNEAQGFDLYLSKLLLAGYCNRLDLIGGYHRSTLEDEVSINTSFTNQNPGGQIPVGAQVGIRDVFNVENTFDGGFFGLIGQAEDGRLSWRTMAKIAFGNMNQEVTISGSTNAGGAVGNTGFYALPTNIGTVERDEFAVVPELNVSVGYKVTNNIQLTAGYTYIYWSNVLLAGDTIDTTINPSQLTGGLVGEARPAVIIKEEDFWYTGLSLGGSIRF